MKPAHPLIRAVLLPLLAMAAIGLSGCGLQPVYSGGSSGIAATALGSIAIGPIANRSGYLVRTALRQELGPVDAAPLFQLEIELDEQILGFGIRDNNSISAERITLRARYTLKDAANKTLLVATTGSDVSIDRVNSNFAVVAAENTAIEQLSVVVAQNIATRLASFAKRGGFKPATPTP
jgi:LPS-assembly lipoprotein